MELRFRPATLEDLPRLTEIYNQAIRSRVCTADLDEMTPEKRTSWFMEHKDPRYPLIVAESKGAVLGYATLTPYRPGRAAVSHVAEISYYLDFAARGQGVGSQLLAHMLALAPALGITDLFAICLGVNSASAGLLKKHGFSLWGRLPGVVHIDGHEIDHLLYGRKLKAIPHK